MGAGTGDGRDEASERQRSLFSWAAFMAGETDEASVKGGGGDEAPTLSLFEWALEREQAGTLAGAGR